MRAMGVFSTPTKRLAPPFTKSLVLLFSYNMGTLICILVLVDSYSLLTDYKYTLSKSNLVNQSEYFFTYMHRVTLAEWIFSMKEAI